MFSQNAVAPSQGDGSSSSPYQIATLDNLYWISQNSSTWDKYFEQTAIINALQTQNWNSGEGFSPIGNETTPFTGSYNGQGNKIYSLQVKRASEDFQGMFGKIDGATIQNFELNIHIEGAKNIGGLVGYMTGSSLISKCIVGGIIDATGAPSNNGSVGGVVGELDNGTIENTFSTINVSITEGIYNGAFVGHVQEGEIRYCYSYGEVTSTQSSSIGGFAGIVTSYGTVENCLWDTEVSGVSGSSGDVEGKTSAEMKELCTYLNAGFDFEGETENGTENVWGINSSDNFLYAFLDFQGYTHDATCCQAPLTIASQMYFGTTTTSTINLSSFVSDDDCDGYIIYINDSETYTRPVDGTSPATDLSWNGSGQQCIYNGTSKTPDITVTGLSVDINYFFSIYKYTLCNSEKKYGERANALRSTSCAPASAGEITLGTTTASTINISSYVASADAEGYVIKIGTSVSNLYAPNNGESPTADLSWNNAGTQCVYNGTSNSPNITITGLEQGNTYYIKVYAYNTCTSSKTYEQNGSLISETMGCAVPNQASSLVFGSITNWSIELESFTEPTPSAYGYVTYINSTNSFVAPENGEHPTQDLSWNNSGQQCVMHSQIGPLSTTVTNLDINTTYYFAVYAYDRCNNVNTFETTGVFASQSTDNNTGVPAGTGTEADPYQIANLSQLKWITENTSQWDKDYIQIADIDASATSNWDDGNGGDAEGFLPIGSEAHKFSGNYNGQNYTITGLYINRPSTDYVGMFGYSTDGAISNLKLENVNITGNDRVGGLIGYSSDDVTNVHVSGSINGNDNIGGLVGFTPRGDKTNCSSNSNVTGNDHVGGLVGYSFNTSSRVKRSGLFNSVEN